MVHRESRPGPAVTPSQFFDNQVYYAVKYYRRVSITSGTVTVNGYIFGVDSYHLGVVDSDLRTHIFPKGTFSALTVEPRTSTFIEREIHRQEIEDMMASFRHLVLAKKTRPTTV